MGLRKGNLPESFNLQQFYAEIRKKMANLATQWTKFFTCYTSRFGETPQKCGCKYFLLTHREFSTSLSVLEGKAVLLWEKWHGKRPNKNCCLSKEGVEKLWEFCQFGYHSHCILVSVVDKSITRYKLKIFPSEKLIVGPNILHFLKELENHDKDWLPQVLLGPLLNTLTQIVNVVRSEFLNFVFQNKRCI